MLSGCQKRGKKRTYGKEREKEKGHNIPFCNRRYPGRKGGGGIREPPSVVPRGRKGKKSFPGKRGKRGGEKKRISHVFIQKKKKRENPLFSTLKKRKCIRKRVKEKEKEGRRTGESHPSKKKEGSVSTELQGVEKEEDEEGGLPVIATGGGVHLLCGKKIRGSIKREREKGGGKGLAVTAEKRRRKKNTMNYLFCQKGKQNRVKKGGRKNSDNNNRGGEGGRERGAFF